MVRVKLLILVLLCLPLLMITEAEAGQGYDFSTLRDLAIDNQGNILVRGHVPKKGSGILKLTADGELIDILGWWLEEVDMVNRQITSGTTRFTRDGSRYGPGDYKFYRFEGLGDEDKGYMWGSTTEVFIVARSKAVFDEFFRFLRASPSVEVINQKVVHLGGHMAVNSKGEICVIGAGLQKVKLPFFLQGKVENRKDGSPAYREDYRYSVAVLDPKDGYPRIIFGKSGIGEGEFTLLQDIAVDSQDNIYVLDWWRDKVIKFNPAGEFIKEWGGWGSGNGQFKGAKSIAIDKRTDTIYVSEIYDPPAQDVYTSGQRRLQKFDREGKYLGSWGYPKIVGILPIFFSPIREFPFNNPRSIAVGVDGNIWIVDSRGGWVNKYTPEGKLLIKFGGEKGDINGDERGKTGYEAEGIAAGPDNIIYVGDGGRIVKFDSKGRYVGEIK